MQDEILKHTKKIHGIVKSPQHSFGEKFKEVSIEIFIIVFAVTLSIWLHSWSEERHQHHEANEFLKGLKNDLAKDIEIIEENKRQVAMLDSNYRYVSAVKNDQHADSLKQRDIYKHLYFDLRVTHPNIGRYEGFKSSGKIGTIQNEKLKESILAFYEQTIPDLVYGENYVNSLQLKILDLVIDKDDKVNAQSFVTSVKMKTLFQLGSSNFENSMHAYDQAMQHAKKVITAIDEEVKH